VTEEQQQNQLARLKKLRETRDNEAVKKARASLKKKRPKEPTTCDPFKIHLDMTIVDPILTFASGTCIQCGNFAFTVSGTENVE